MKNKVLVIGAGLAGSECAFSLAQKEIPVVLLESKKLEKNPSQKLDGPAELVCTNSLKSLNPASAHGVLKYEMESMGSIVLELAHKARVPAGDALAVDRELFSRLINEALDSQEFIQRFDEVVSDPIKAMEKYDCQYVVVATGPLTVGGLDHWVQENLSNDDLYFYDAIAPVVDADTLDLSQMYFKDRHKEHDESADYLNVPLNEEQYYHFIEELKNAEKTPSKDFEKFQYFESCLPIDVMAERGNETARFSCMKPIGLEFKDGSLPYAAVQLRKENLLGSAYNLVGFQTKLKYPEQKRVLRMLPGFENAEFLHYGSVHRNTFIHAKKLLNFDMSTQKMPRLYFAGQISGVEGYTESASMGLYVAYQIHRKINGLEPLKFPVETAMGALVNYVMTAPKPAPSNINFGLMPTIKLNREQRKHPRRKMLKKEIAGMRAKESFDEYMKGAQ